MVKDIDHLLKENQKLIHEKDELHSKLKEAIEIIEAIKRGNIDAVFIGNNETDKVFASKTADQSYRRFIENMSEGVVTLHTDGTILYSNSSFAKLVNLPLEKVIGTNLRNYIPLEYLENFEHFFTKNPENNSKVELSISNHNGIHTYFIVSLNRFQLHDLVALNLVWTNVTDHKKAEENLMAVNENLKEANIELATFAHIASHDLQEPLRKIITYSSRLISDYYDIIDERGQNYINNMQSASARMRNLIDDILEYSELSQKDSLFKPTDLQSIVKEILSNLEIVIKETKAKITIEKELPVIEANSTQMRQLFQNIISNSLKFIKPDIIPEISITYEIIKGKEMEKISARMLDKKFCIFYIKDNGIGFNQKNTNKIFTIFQRLNDNSVYQGTGVGLAICKKIVEKHRGFLTAESKLNEGSLFTITLPVSQESLARPSKEQGSQSGILNS